jgi:hypothetical protein
MMNGQQEKEWRRPVHKELCAAKFSKKGTSSGAILMDRPAQAQFIFLFPVISHTIKEMTVENEFIALRWTHTQWTPSLKWSLREASWLCVCCRFTNPKSTAQTHRTAVDLSRICCAAGSVRPFPSNGRHKGEVSRFSISLFLFFFLLAQFVSLCGRERKRKEKLYGSSPNDL